MVSHSPKSDLPPADKSKLASLLDYFHRIHFREVELGLTRIQQLLTYLGNPHHHLPPIIHVAGTNGKGSTVSFLRHIYESAGYKVHTYTSPHLVHFNERIRIAGKLISDEMLVDYLLRVKEANQERPITFFEATTAAAFLAFSEIPADVVLLETGLGGRLDATNVIESPVACVITPISMDHQGFLGDSLEKIAEEKAGIIKHKTPTFMANQTQGVEEILCKKVSMQQGTPYRYGKEWHVTIEEGGFKLILNDQSFDLPIPNLKGQHQIINAGLACMTALSLLTILPLEIDHLKQALIKATWPGRLQKLEINHADIWLDGAHNEAGFNSLSQFIKDEPKTEKVTIILAMLKNRDPAIFFEKFLTLADKFIVFDMQDDRFHQPETLLGYCGDRGEMIVFPEKLKPFLEKKALGARIFITGSLYLIGRVLGGLENDGSK